MCSPFGFRDIEPKLLAIDAFRAYNTVEVIAAFKKLKTTVSLIPGGCIGFVDVALNQPMKMLIKEEADDHYDTHIEQWTANKIYCWREKDYAYPLDCESLEKTAYRV
jgi:hypothetical protein